MKLQLLSLSVALLWALLWTGADGQCSFSYSVTSSARISSPSYPSTRPRYRCRSTYIRLTAPAGSTITLACPDFYVSCSNRFIFSPPYARTCGSRFTTRTTSSNVLTLNILAYRNRAWWYWSRRSLRFYCTATVNSNGGTPPSATTTTTTTTTTTVNPSNRCSCGTAIVRTDPRIVGGQDATYGEYPYQARILNGAFAFCGGSLISSTYIVSAAHCSISTRHTAKLGDHRQNNIDSGEITVRFAQVIQHPSYSSSTNRFDVSLIRLTSPVTFTNYIRPICLPDAFTGTTFTGTRLRASGWGRLSYNGATPNTLQEVNVDAVSEGQCANVYGSSRIFREMICALRPGRDTCQGDSGGPLAYDRNNIWYLIGITSFGFECARPNIPGVYTKVANSGVLSWIKSNAGITCTAP